MPTASRAFAWLAAALLTPAAAQVTHVQLTQPLRLAGPLQPDKGGSAVYIVKLRTPGAASYKRDARRLLGDQTQRRGARRTRRRS